MNTRIKVLRESLHLSQTDFGARVKLTGGAISMMESGARKASDRTLSDISRAYGVSRLWLETGEGPMLIEPESDDELVEACMSGENETAKNIMKAFAKAGRDNPEIWDALKIVVDALNKAGL